MALQIWALQNMECLKQCVSFGNTLMFLCNPTQREASVSTMRKLVLTNDGNMAAAVVNLQ